MSNKPNNTQNLIVGIDEAGRGPVFGPLVMVAVAVDEEGELKLKQLGVKDSKKLTKEKREELFPKIREIVKDYRVEVIEASAIDAALVDPTINLNWLEALTAARLVNELQPGKAIVDCPSPNISMYHDYFLSKLEGKAQQSALVIEHKADVNHVVVSAASIVAKVIRDWEVEKIKEEVGSDCGSGYMTDPLTVAFLDRHFASHSHLFRRNWASYQERISAKKQRKLGEF